MNTGALSLHEGVLFIGRYTGSGDIFVFDLDGRQLEAGFSLPPSANTTSVAITGLAVDGDRKLWIADAFAGRVRCVNLFGKVGADFAPALGRLEAPLSGATLGGDGAPVDVALAESSKWTGIFVATAGKRVGAIALYLANGTRLLALRSLGSPKEPFDRVARMSSSADLLWVVEAGARRVQVFRAGDFHFSFPVGRLGEQQSAPEGLPRALAPVGDGRLVVAIEEDVARGDASNAGLFLLTGRGLSLQKLAAAGTAEGQISHPIDIAVEAIRPWPHETEAEVDRRRRVVVLDLDGDRIQVFNLAGRCYGAFPTFEECEKPKFTPQIEADTPNRGKRG